MAAQERNGHLAPGERDAEIICEAVERAAVANGRKNFVDRGPRRYESSPGELLPQTLPSEPSTAVVEQHADHFPDLPPTVPSAQSLHMLTLAGSAGSHGASGRGLERTGLLKLPV